MLGGPLLGYEWWYGMSMNQIVKYFVIICSIWSCNGISFREQREENVLESNEDQSNSDEEPSRRVLAHSTDAIIGAPSIPSHLPAAEPILPGHTLIRPALGMLKSAVKFPHKDLENGAGVYGNIDNLGIRYDGQNQRVLYTGFRRNNLPADYIVVSPLKTKTPQPKENLRFILSSVVLDLEKDKDVTRKILNALLRKRRNVGSTRIIQAYPSKPASTLHRSATRSRNPFLHNKSPNIKIVVYKSAGKNKGGLRTVDEKVDEDDNVSASSSKENNTSIDNRDVETDVESKKTWFWNSKNTYDHLKINQDAPEHFELMPVNLSNNLRNWWFFSQDDYVAFTNTLE